MSNLLETHFFTKNHNFKFKEHYQYVQYQGTLERQLFSVTVIIRKEIQIIAFPANFGSW